MFIRAGAIVGFLIGGYLTGNQFLYIIAFAIVGTFFIVPQMERSKFWRSVRGW